MWSTNRRGRHNPRKNKSTSQMQECILQLTDATLGVYICMSISCAVNEQNACYTTEQEAENACSHDPLIDCSTRSLFESSMHYQQQIRAWAAVAMEGIEGGHRHTKLISAKGHVTCVCGTGCVLDSPEISAVAASFCHQLPSNSGPTCHHCRHHL